MGAVGLAFCSPPVVCVWAGLRVDTGIHSADAGATHSDASDKSIYARVLVS